jgi:hypothetical protein
MSWSTVSQGVCPPGWAQLSSVTTSVDVGVDFNWRIWDVGPLRICEDRPVTITELFGEGKP